jgi:hypothetical protein
MEVRTNISDKVDATSSVPASVFERQLDNLVYRLYSLTYDEVKMIEPDFPLSETSYEGIK